MKHIKQLALEALERSINEAVIEFDADEAYEILLAMSGAPGYKLKPYDIETLEEDGYEKDTVKAYIDLFAPISSRISDVQDGSSIKKGIRNWQASGDPHDFIKEMDAKCPFVFIQPDGMGDGGILIELKKVNQKLIDFLNRADRDMDSGILIYCTE